MKKSYRAERNWVEERMSSSKSFRQKKSSLWSWAPIQAIAKIGQQQFYCVFSVFVQMIDGLPSSLDSLRLVVQVERKSKVWQTMPSRVFQHIAEFDETLQIQTTIFGRESNIQGHTLKFMPKDYILSVVAIDAPEHFPFNQHRIDLSRLLPGYVEGFWEPDKPMSSTASFKLGGKAEGAVLVATFDFEVLNEELRQPNLSTDGNTSARFKGSSLRPVSRAVKSLPNSPNPSPFVRRQHYHFTSPCASDIESTDGTCIEKSELDSSAKATEDWAAEDYSSSDEERYQALRNDPLVLDPHADTESAAFSPALRRQKGLGSVNSFSRQSHLANLYCGEKVEVPLARRTKSDTDTLCHHIEFRRLLNCEEPEMEGNIVIHGKQESGRFSFLNGLQLLERRHHPDKLTSDVVESFEIPAASRMKSDTQDREQIDIGTEVKCREAEEVALFVHSKHKVTPCFDSEDLERNVHAAEMAADKYCINVEPIEKCPTANVSKAALNDKNSSDERVKEQFFTRDLMPSSPFLRLKCVSDDREDIKLEELDVVSEVNEKHMLVDGVQASFSVTDEYPLRVIQSSPSRTFSFTTVRSVDERVVCDETFPKEVALEHFGEYESSLTESLQIPSVSQSGFASKSFDSNEDVELDIFPCRSEDDEMSLAASVVAEDFLDLLEREEEDFCTLLSSPGPLEREESCRQELSLEESWSTQTVESYTTKKSSPVAQVEMDMYDSSSLKPIVCTTASYSEAGHEESEALDCGRIISNRFQDCDMETCFEDELGLFSIIEAAELEMKKATQTRRSRERAKIIEDAEAKALMEKWGLTDKVFENASSNVFSFEAYWQRQQSISMIKLQDGGSLKVVSVDSCQPGTNLVMQVSRPIVIPATNAQVVDILGSMASQGLHEMTVQASMRMPLADLMGLSLEHFVATDVAAVDSGLSGTSSRQGFFPGHTMKESSVTDYMAFEPLDKECPSEEVVYFGDLTKMALKRIEPLAIEGLKVQCNLSTTAPDHVRVNSSVIPDRTNQINERALAKVSSAKSLLDMTISLDDWLQVHDGARRIEAEIPLSKTYEESSEVDDVSEAQARASFSDELTVAMLLQLRDPRRYYEPVGASMMALVQAERITQHCASSSASGNEDKAASSIHGNQGIDEGHETLSGVKLKITGVHVAGVQVSEDTTCKPWGSKEQLQSGNRWLVTNSRTNKSRHIRSQSSSQVGSKANSGKTDILWSISASCVQSADSSWRESENIYSYIRNPDLIFTTDNTVGSS